VRASDECLRRYLPRSDCPPLPDLLPPPSPDERDACDPETSFAGDYLQAKQIYLVVKVVVIVVLIYLIITVFDRFCSTKFDGNISAFAIQSEEGLGSVIANVHKKLCCRRQTVRCFELYGSLLYHFQDKARYLLKIAIFSSLHSMPSLRDLRRNWC